MQEDKKLIERALKDWRSSLEYYLDQNDGDGYLPGKFRMNLAQINAELARRIPEKFISRLTGRLYYHDSLDPLLRVYLDNSNIDL